MAGNEESDDPEEERCKELIEQVRQHVMWCVIYKRSQEMVWAAGMGWRGGQLNELAHVARS